MVKRTIAGKDDAGVDKIMYWYKDNFLSDSLFKTFNKEILDRYEPRKEWVDDDIYGLHLSGENYKEDAPVRIKGEAYPEKNEYIHSAVKLRSKSLPEIVRTIKKCMIEDMQLVNPLARMMWFQYHSNKHKVIQHYDNTLAGKSSKQSFTSLVYMHETWEDTWGGELTFLNDKQSILPKPNRLLVYSRDEEHWVNEITHDLEDYKRMFLFTAWTVDNDF